MEVAVRIARAQLAGARRTRREVPADPLIGLLHKSPAWTYSVALHADPGRPFEAGRVRAAVARLLAAFTEERKRLSIELVQEASPGLAEEIVAAGLAVLDRPPLLALDSEVVEARPAPPPVRVRVARDQADHDLVNEVVAVAYESARLRTDFPVTPREGGSVLLEWDGAPVATASWLAVADGVAEIAGVGTVPAFRGRGLGALATRAAVLAGRDRAGVRLPWLTPGDAGAERLYRRLGFGDVGTAVHLGPAY